MVRLLRLFFWLTVSFFLVFGILALSLRTQVVQTTIVQWLAQKVTDKLGYECSIGGFYLDWVDFAHITNVKVKDKKGYTMIEVKDLRVNLKLAALLERNINLDLVELSNGIVEVRKDKITREININEFINAITDWVDDGDTTRSPNPKIFSIDKSVLNKMTFSFMDETEPTLPNQFDYYHFKLKGIHGIVENFWQRRDTIRLRAVKLMGRDLATGLEIHDLSTQFRYTKHDMVFGKLHAEVGDSYLGDSLAFQFESTDDFSDFNQKVQMVAHLDSSILHAQDLSFFNPILKDWYEVYNLSGNLEGTVDNFRLKKMRLFTGRNTFLTGSLNMRGLPEIDETFVDLRLKPSFVNPVDLEFYAGKDAADYLSMLGVFDVSGSFTGFFKNFVTRSTFETKLGTLNADIQMEIKDDLQASTYNGRLETASFDLGSLLNKRKYVQEIDFNGTIRGKGFTPKKADVYVKADVNSFGVLGYNYVKIKTDGHYRNQEYSGNLSIKDPHLIFNGTGKVDLRKGKEEVDLDVVLGRANFKPLKLTQDALDASAEVDMHFKGFDFDNFLGESKMKNVRVLFRDERLDLDEVSIESHIDNGNKTFTFNSPLVDMVLEGSFKYKKFVEDAVSLVDEYTRLIKNQPRLNMEAFVKERKKAAVDYGISAKLNIKDINPLLDLLDQPLTISQNTEVDARLQFGTTEMLLINSHIDSIRYQNKTMYETSIDISATKTIERPDVLAEVYVYSEQQNWTPDIQTEKILFDGVWDKGKIGFKLLGKEKNNTNRADIYGEVKFEPQTTRIQLKNSSLSLVERIWNINQDNEIEISDSATVNFRNVSMSNENQQLSMEGFLTGRPEDTLYIKARNFELTTLKPILKEELTGRVNAGIVVTHLNDSPLFEGFVKADSLVYEKFLVGDFSGQANWNQQQKNLEINGNLVRDQQEMLQLTGFYTPELPEPIQMKARVNRLNINFLQIILGNNVSNLRGLASGDLFVKGSFSKPTLTGSVFVRDGQVKINYLNTTYLFSHQVTFLPNEINADGAVVIDENGQPGTFTRAALRHQFFDQFYVDVAGRLNNYLVFNIPQKAGEMYYGSAVCTGRMSITGRFDDITIKATARTNKGTRIFIPLDGTVNEDLGESYITFTNRKAGQAVPKDTVQKMRLSGIKMDFDLDVTDDAYGEIIFDKKAGDIIRARGSGKIKMIVDTRGEFSVIGQYVINKGDYHFTTYNLVNKDFDIRPGSTITWNGPVLEGVMDILAEYNLNASLGPLASSDQQIQQKPESKRRYPVTVSMRLTEQLLKPNITLGLDIKDYPRNSDLNYYVQAFLARIATDEQELNRQVFSLMIFRMFAPQGEFTNTANISYSSFSDLVSNQLSSWLSQFDENLEVSVDLSGLSQADLNNFQLRFSYTLLEGRLRLTRDGGFTNAQNQASALSIAGDWTLEYMLSKNGDYRVKMFHRINQNLILSGLSNNNTTQGASLLHTQSFNKLSDLFPKRKKKESKKQEPVRKEDPLPPATNPEKNKENLTGTVGE